MWNRLSAESRRTARRLLWIVPVLVVACLLWFAYAIFRRKVDQRNYSILEKWDKIDEKYEVESEEERKRFMREVDAIKRKHRVRRSLEKQRMVAEIEQNVRNPRKLLKELNKLAKQWAKDG